MLQSTTVHSVFNKIISLRISSCDDYALTKYSKEVTLDELRVFINENTESWAHCKYLPNKSHLFQYWDNLNRNLNQGIEAARNIKRSDEEQIVNCILSQLSMPPIDGDECRNSINSNVKIQRELTINSASTYDDDYPKIFEFVDHISKQLAKVNSIEYLDDAITYYISYTKNPSSAISGLDSIYPYIAKTALYCFREYVFSDKENWNRIIYKTLNRYETILKSQKNSFNLSLKETEDTLTRISDFAENEHNSLLALEETYREKIKLEVPENLWNEQARHYSDSADRCIVFIIFTAFVFIILLSHLLPNLLNLQSGPSWFSPTLALVSAISFVLYLIRVFIKQFQSNKHLEITCRERAALTRFYQALVYESNKSGNGEVELIKEKQRLLIFQTLFTIADTGLVKTDSSTQNIETLLSLIKRS